ncbi:MAG: hypothetical protein SO016_08515 [Lachnospiraceae bacterium]|nr:hypothetical protein [Robinsoniella sp.]MDY3766715.1 hypothetical protein [Lachnospiraceae bacterium]
MGEKTNKILQVEERLNTKYQVEKIYPSTPNMVFKYRDALEDALKNHPMGESLYEMICRWIERMRNPYFVKKNGKLDEAGFYTYAMIDKNTWSNIRWNKTVPKKETLLKLIIALKLNRREADELMNKASNSLTDSDPRDRIIMALIDIQCYEIEEVYEILEEYGKDAEHPFPNIY